jgi:hypothetical protein
LSLLLQQIEQLCSDQGKMSSSERFCQFSYSSAMIIYLFLILWKVEGEEIFKRRGRTTYQFDRAILEMVQTEGLHN